jgi:hypothetical protein
VLSFRVLSRTNIAYLSHRSSLNRRPVNLLQPLWRSQKSQLLWNQANPASFCKTPGAGVPLRKLVPCTEAQKCLLVSPLFATLTHSMSRKSFVCHSYANTRDGGASVRPRHDPGNANLPIGVHFRRHMRHVTPLSLVASVDCAYFPSPRGCTPPSCATTSFPAFRHANSFAFKSLPALCRLFALFSAFVSFVFNRLQPLFPKHPGYGVRFSLPRSPLATRPGEDCR